MLALNGCNVCTPQENHEHILNYKIHSGHEQEHIIGLVEATYVRKQKMI